MKFEYKVGDKVEIIANHSSHCFDIGSIVTIMGIDNRDRTYPVGSSIGKEGWTWYFNLLKDVKPINANSIRWKKKRGATC